MKAISNWDLCYDDMNLYITPDCFIVEPNGKEELLIIDRNCSEAKVQLKTSQLNHRMPTRRVCGILGTISLIGSNYLLVATHRLYVGMINDAVIWRLAGYDIIPYIPNACLNAHQLKNNEVLLKMLRKTMDTPHFYFSYAYNLTHSQQRAHQLSAKIKQQKSLMEGIDDRFVWNKTLLSNFRCSDMDRFQLPLILGFVSVNQVQINGQTFFWSIISRRSVHKAGTRFFSRGINDDGQVANFVETEQIVEYNGQCVSFVQTRGSMPFYWSQLPNLRYKPRPHKINGKDHLLACKRHFEEQIALYGQQVLVNLVNQTGSEGELESFFRSLLQLLKNSKLRYEAFDFHAECKKVRYDRLTILIDRLAHEQDQFSEFHLVNSNKAVSTQKGVFRTNCIDCLDRTNVVQSMLARRSLQKTLEKLGILHPSQKIELASPNFELIFKAVWADNADMISMQYSGTGALKTDFTRTGKRTKRGLLQDGVNALTRYYINNFTDGFRQDGIDLFLGRYVVTDPLCAPLEVKRSWRYNAFPSILVFAVAMLYITALMPSNFKTENLLFMLFSGALIAVSATGMFHYGHEFIDWPRLFRPIRFQV
uniref:Phosphatidylinositol-3-phosphatase SAC1 n=1 Tax=Glossina pallidipes TaxID=7398 RepID=A0A1A9ZB97_GLOPL